MPELPDVELFRREIDGVLGRTIARVVVSDARILGDLRPKAFVARLEGNRLEQSRRHGKHLLGRLAENGWLTLHLGMTGALVAFAEVADDPPYDRVRLDFEGGGHLAYVNKRMLGRVGLAAAADAFVRDQGLGPDALDPALDAEAFAAALGDRRRDVKAALLDQALIAGIGNLYADEILFQARLHPKTPVRSLDPAARAALFGHMRRVLRTAIDRAAGAEQLIERLPDDYLLPRRRQDGTCPRCGTPLAALKLAGRTSWLCPTCQAAP